MKKLFILTLAVAVCLAVSTSGFAIKKDVVFKTVGSEGTVTFSHEVHTEKNGLKCAECHPKIFKMKAGGDEGVNMAAMKEGKFCGACHDGKKAFNTTSPDNCAKCHKKG